LPYPFVNRLSHAMSFCLAMFALACVFTVDFIGPDLYTRGFIKNGLPVSYTEIHRNHGRLLFVSRACVLFGVVAGIIWLFWQFRCQSNVRALGARGLLFRPTFTVLAWAVPVANLVLPALAVGELWRSSDPDVGPDEWRRNRSSPLIWVWWLSFLAGLALLGLAYARIIGVAGPGVEALITRDRFVRGAAGVGIVTSLLGIVLVESINARVFGKMEALTASSWSVWRDQGVR
jgi:Domain of unknown function (DUF4328)